MIPSVQDATASSAAATSPAFDINEVMKIVTESTKRVTDVMNQKLLEGKQQNMNFKALAAKHINPKVQEEVEGSDAKTQMVYKKLFLATLEHVQKNSIPLQMTFLMMNQQTGDTQAGGKFLGSFVLPETKSMIETLEKEQPAALEAPEIWK